MRFFLLSLFPRSALCRLSSLRVSSDSGVGEYMLYRLEFIIRLINFSSAASNHRSSHKTTISPFLCSLIYSEDALRGGYWKMKYYHIWGYDVCCKTGTMCWPFSHLPRAHSVAYLRVYNFNSKNLLPSLAGGIGFW